MAEVKVFDREMNEVVIPGLTWIEFEPISPETEMTTERYGGREIVVSVETKPRYVKCKFMLNTSSVIYYKMMRDDMFHLLSPEDFFYVIDMGFAGKRWGGYFQGGYDLERVRGDVAIISTTLYSPLPYSESRATTLNDFTYLEEVWSYGMGLVYDEGTQQYIHSTNSFQIYNAGQKTVDPRVFELVIKLKSNGATATSLELKNNTTDDVWQYNGPLNSGEEIVLDGIKMLKNAVNIVGDTNFRLITLKPGFNDFTLSGVTGAFEISFEFRYLYA